MGFKLTTDEHWSLGKVSELHENSQAKDLGVKCGWRIKNVDGERISAANFQILRAKLISGKKCFINFETEADKIDLNLTKSKHDEELRLNTIDNVQKHIRNDLEENKYIVKLRLPNAYYDETEKVKLLEECTKVFKGSPKKIECINAEEGSIICEIESAYDTEESNEIVPEYLNKVEEINGYSTKDYQLYIVQDSWTMSIIFPNVQQQDLLEFQSFCIFMKNRSCFDLSFIIRNAKRGINIISNCVKLNLDEVLCFLITMN
jgi:hypothetical protein